jgi:hypothetical protein
MLQGLLVFNQVTATLMDSVRKEGRALSGRTVGTV